MLKMFWPRTENEWMKMKRHYGMTEQHYHFTATPLFWLGNERPSVCMSCPLLHVHFLVTPASPHSPKSCIWSKLTFACEWLFTFKSYPCDLLPWWKIKLKILYEMHFTIHFLKILFFETIEQHLMWSFILTFIFVQFYW